MAGKTDLTVLRLPKGFSASSLRPLPPKSGDVLEGGDFSTAFESAGDSTDDARRAEAISALEIERLEVTEDERRKLEAEDETLGAVQTMFFDHVKPVSTADGAHAAQNEVAWGREAIGLTSETKLTGKGVTIAVLDTGIDGNYKEHPAFRSIASRIEPKNFTSNDEHAWQDHGTGHGTHVAGTIFGQPVNGVDIGVATGIERALIGKVLSNHGGSTDSIYKGILWAVTEGADIISMSLAIDFERLRRYQIEINDRSEAEATSITLKSYRENFTLFDRLSSLFSIGGTRVRSPVVVVATGNESARPDYTIEASPPAVAESFISVNAVDVALEVAPFSNTLGTLSAPGVGILSAALGDGLRLDSGTSMAAPHVAGAAALWIENLTEHGPRSANAIRDAMTESAHPLHKSHTERDDYGRGLVRVPGAPSLVS